MRDSATVGCWLQVLLIRNVLKRTIHMLYLRPRLSLVLPCRQFAVLDVRHHSTHTLRWFFGCIIGQAAANVQQDCQKG